MTKQFCDICGEPAIESIYDLGAEHLHPIGEVYRRSKGSSLTEETCQCKIRLHASFSFVEHPTGLGGPPDLCHACREQLLKKLAEGAAS